MGNVKSKFADKSGLHEISFFFFSLFFFTYLLCKLYEQSENFSWEILIGKWFYGKIKAYLKRRYRQK